MTFTKSADSAGSLFRRNGCQIRRGNLLPPLPGHRVRRRRNPVLGTPSTGTPLRRFQMPQLTEEAREEVVELLLQRLRCLFQPSKKVRHFHLHSSLKSYKEHVMLFFSEIIITLQFIQFFFFIFRRRRIFLFLHLTTIFDLVRRFRK
jgi:hypothetical protein